MISVRFQGKPFNITVIQVYAPTSKAEEAEVEQFCQDLQDLLELIPPKKGQKYLDPLPKFTFFFLYFTMLSTSTNLIQYSSAQMHILSGPDNPW